MNFNYSFYIFIFSSIHAIFSKPVTKKKKQFLYVFLVFFNNLTV